MPPKSKEKAKDEKNPEPVEEVSKESAYERAIAERDLIIQSLKLKIQKSQDDSAGLSAKNTKLESELEGARKCLSDVTEHLKRDLKTKVRFRD